MPKSTKTPPKPAKRAAAKSAARNTDSGPSQVTAALFDANSRKAAETQELAAAMPHNIVSRSPLEEGKYLCQDALIVPHGLSTCTSAASAWGSQKVMSMAR